ncbi:HAD family hydrolase [Defluviicoccus vanus]|uniref:HAD family phosphatase n=1 Tax=Defluviicoccus vanus TaxID=111831 RepID=A0A7H1N2T7_9PROT|nr:HAD family phosphatase [Defluviicoccus vanus]QNT70023.1 HAD family phosphatase [Defluviicoccus vanus]
MLRPAAAPASLTTVIFDVGGVLLDWNPRYLYRQLIADAAVMEDFLARVCTPDWNHRQDEGRSFADAVAERTALFPEHAALIAAYDQRWDEMVQGAIEHTVQLLYQLKERGVRLLALTNFSTEKLPQMLQRYPFFACFEAMVVSGEVGIAKPDPRIFAHLIAVCGLQPGDCLFIDDVPANVAAAQDAGLHAIRFTTAAALTVSLREYGILES